jgi:hypothetical protein
MPRTTLDLDSSVLQELRRRGERERKSMGQVASELLAGALAAAGRDESVSSFAWKSADLGAPRVDLEDEEAMMRILDRIE